jgi:5'-nucleotidase
MPSIDWRVIPVTSQTKEDPRFALIYHKYGALLKELSRVVGRTLVELDARSKTGRTQETNVGDFIADSFRAATRADAGLMNGGSIRADEIIPPGPLTKRDVLSILPFKNRVVKLELTGALLREALEQGVRRMRNRAGFPRYLALDSRLMPGDRQGHESSS